MRDLKKILEENRQIKELLQAAEICGSVDAAGTAGIHDMITKKKKNLVISAYLADHPRLKTKYEKGECGLFNKSGSYYRSTKPVLYASTEEELLDKLYAVYCNNSVETVYYKMIDQAVSEHTPPKTIEEWHSLWKNHISTEKIFQGDITEIDRNDIRHLYLRWTGNGMMTKKAFGNRRGLLNRIFEYASEQGIISENFIPLIGTKKLKFALPTLKKKAYTHAERRALLACIESSETCGYALAARFALNLPLRIGEIRGLQYGDYDAKRHTIRIIRQIRDERDVSVDTDTLTLTKKQREQIIRNPKGNPNYSIREVPLTQSAESIIKEARHLNPFGEYLFMQYGRPLNGDTFNDWLRKFSADAGVPYLSSHKLRFTVASLLYNGGKGVDAKTLQRIMGHSTLAMTLHYLEAYDSSDITDCREEMNAALAVL